MATADQPVERNRWDLLHPVVGEAPTVSVVIAHYEQPEQLARTHRALERQTQPPMEIVVADDGSGIVPAAGDLGPRTIVVGQPDLGFRAAAVRNLGVRHCHGDIVVFLDADTSPERRFLERLTGRVAACRDVVAVGRRRHARLGGLPLDTDPAAAPRLDEPEWLRAGYSATRDLLDADGRSFRFVISAVMACRRSLLLELGGFDERFVGYGGEDWDLAYRAWNAGAVLVHEPLAVAWHDGPEWADRRPRGTSQDPSSMRLAQLIPEPSTRGAPMPAAIPDVLVDLSPTLPTGDVVRCVHSLLRQSFRDLRVRLPPAVDPATAALYGANATTAAWTGEQMRRARARLLVEGPLPEGGVGRAMELLVGDDLGEVVVRTSGVVAATLTSTRARARAERWQDRFAPADAVDFFFGRGAVEVGSAPLTRDDLAGFFAKRGRGGM